MDEQSKTQTIDTIETLKKNGKTVILITHKEEELAICDEVYRLGNNKLAKQEF